AAPTRPIEYFEIIPSPIHAPTAHQPLDRLPINTRSSEYSAPAQQAVRGASGVIKNETEKKNGRTCMNSTATNPTDLLNKLRANPYTKNDAISQQANAPMRTPNSLRPKTAVPSRMIHATIGG